MKHKGFALLGRYPQFAKYWLASVLSIFGDQVGWIALVWLVLRIGGGPAAVGIVTFLYLVPQAVLAPLAGVWLDRLPKARAMAIANALIGGVFLAIPLLVGTGGSDRLPIVYGLVAIVGCALPFDTTGSTPMIGELIPEEDWSPAYLLTQTQYQFATLVGPAVGGILIAAIGTESLLYVDAATFFILSLTLLSIPAQPQATVLSEKQSLLNEFREGFEFLKGTRSILALSVVAFFFYMLYGPYNVVLPVLARARYSGSAEFGLLWSAFSAGALVGSLVFSRSSWNRRLSMTLATIIGLWGIVTFALAFARSFGWALVIMCLGGLEYSPWNALVTTVRQRVVPRRLQSRVTGVTQAITAGGEPLGALAAGVTLHALGAFWTLLLAGATTALLSLAAAIWPAFRELDQAVGPAETSQSVSGS